MAVLDLDPESKQKSAAAQPDPANPWFTRVRESTVQAHRHVHLLRQRVSVCQLWIDCVDTGRARAASLTGWQPSCWRHRSASPLSSEWTSSASLWTPTRHSEWLLLAEPQLLALFWLRPGDLDNQRRGCSLDYAFPLLLVGMSRARQRWNPFGNTVERSAVCWTLNAGECDFLPSMD